MSGWEGIALAVLTLGSSLTSYWIGQRSIILRFRRRDERRRRWREFTDAD
jgi:hypothetical protein